jgi:hypothetical protein
MFSVMCPRHGCDILLSERRIRDLRSTDHGVELEWECWCGHRGTEVLGRLTPAFDGRRRPAV